MQPAPGVEPGDALAAELTAYPRERIAHFKVPGEIRFRDELPRTPTGKVRRLDLPELLGLPELAEDGS